MVSTSQVAGLRRREAAIDPPDLAAATIDLTDDLDDQVVASFLTESDRDAAYGSPAALEAGASRRGMTCYVHSRRSLCTFDAVDWRWSCNPRVIYQLYGVTANPPSTAVATPGTVFNTSSISLPGGQRLVSIEFFGIGYVGGAFADIWGRVDINGTNLGAMASQEIPFHLPPAGASTLATSDTPVQGRWSGKVTGPVTVIATIVKVIGDDRPYIRQASLTVIDHGPVD